MSTTEKPSILHQAMVGAMKLMRFSHRTAADKLESVRKRDRTWTPPEPPKRLTEGMIVTQSSEHGWPVWSIKPVGAKSDRSVIVAVHGGGYTTEILYPQWSFYAFLAREGGAELIVPIYPLAPHGTAGTVVPVVADIITEQIDQHGAERVRLLGDSAGAGLIVAAAQELVRREREVPQRMVLISPWLNAAIDDPRSRQVDDPFGSVDALQESGRLWAGNLGATNPLASPLNGSFEGLPATWVYAGSRDMLYIDSVKLQERAIREHLPFVFDLRPGLIHGWAGFSFLPEAKEVAPRILAELTDPRISLPR